MKRFFVLTLLVLLISGIATAQNSNRHGFFFEAGIGGLIGSTPRMSIYIEDNIVYNKCVYGTAADIGLGGRFRIGNHWAYEIKAEGMIPLSDPINAVVGQILPIEFRYTSGELWKNYSIFAHANIGGAMTGLNGKTENCNLDYSYNDDQIDNGIIAPDGTSIKLKSKDCTFGTAYSVGVGINLSTHLYLEGCFNAQGMFNCFGKEKSRILHYGVMSGVIGYRF